MQEVKSTGKRRKLNKVRILLVSLAFLFLVYSAVTIITQSITVSQKKAEPESLTEQLKIQEIKNKDIKNVLDYTGEEEKEYMEQIARQDLDYIVQGERVFINISGD